MLELAFPSASTEEEATAHTAGQDVTRMALIALCRGLEAVLFLVAGVEPDFRDRGTLHVQSMDAVNIYLNM